MDGTQWTKVVHSAENGITSSNAGSILATGNILMPQIRRPVASMMSPPAAEKSAALDEFKFEYADGFDTPGHALITGFVSTFSHASGDVETGTWTADMRIEVTEAEFVDGSPAE